MTTATEQKTLETQVNQGVHLRLVELAPASSLEDAVSETPDETSRPVPEERLQLARFVYNRRTDPKKQTPTFETLGEELLLVSGGKVGSRETARRYFNLISTMPDEERVPRQEPVVIFGGDGETGKISLYSAAQLMKLPVEVTFEGSSTDPNGLQNAIVAGLDAYSRGDLVKYSEARDEGRRILLGDYYKLAEFGKYLAAKHMRAPQLTMKSCAGVTGFTLKNGSHPRLYLEMHALLGRVKTFVRLGVKYLQRQVVDKDRAKAIEQGKKESSWELSPNGLYLKHQIGDLQALRVKYATREEVLCFGELLENDPRVEVLDVEYHNKPDTGYRGVHWQVRLDSKGNRPLCIEIQGHDREVFERAKKDGYHATTKRCMESPEDLVACRE